MYWPFDNNSPDGALGLVPSLARGRVPSARHCRRETRGRRLILGGKLLPVFLDEFFEVRHRGQEFLPLTLIEGHRKPPQTVDAYAALLGDLEAYRPAVLLGFKFGHPAPKLLV